MSIRWTLEDVEELAVRVSGFDLPPLETRSSLAVGDLVRLHFVLPEPTTAGMRAERMWVEVQEANGGRYRGQLTNDPVGISELCIGEMVEFDACHVAQLRVGAERAERAALVSQRVLDSGRFAACWMYREVGADPRDSGWRLFVGDETEAELNDPTTVKICTLQVLEGLEPSLKKMFLSPVGAAFERAEPAQRWRRVRR